MSETYDTPDTEDLYQEDETYPEKATPVPVCIDDVVRTEEMPSRLGSMRVIPIIAANPEPTLIVNDNPKRKRITMWTMPALDTEAVFVCVGMTRDEAFGFTGVLIPPGGTIVIDGSFSGQLWARTCLVTDAIGVFTDITPSTDDMLLSVVTEDWAR